MRNICGLVSIVGSSNAGKSTLINRLLGHKLSITSHNILTTRKQILGIKTTGNIQIIFLDTPGVVNNTYNNYNKIWKNAIDISDCVLFVINRIKWTVEEQILCNYLKKNKSSIILVINKIDCIKNQTSLLPWLNFLYKTINCSEIIPISAKLGVGIKELESIIISHLPNNQHYFPANMKTDLNKSFFFAEIIRENIINKLHSELSFCISVKIENLINKFNHMVINALILVKRTSQKFIILGIIQQICNDSRSIIEKFFKKKIMLKFWVKVKKH